MSKFVLDANIFIDAHQRYYSFDIAPAFWCALKGQAENGTIVSVDHVLRELNHSNDEDKLRLWANNEFKKWFESTDDDKIFMAYSEIITWAMRQQQFNEPAKSEFASVADSWLIACAKARNYIIVTHEVYDDHIRRKIPIPNVCRAFDIPYINTFDMLRRLHIRLG
jgi:hypothetical protein